jgi:phosphate transport system ATP-binding protein
MAKRIDVKDLDIFYGDFKAVEGVSMTVEPRSVTAFIGPSGCGKSTVLRTLNRMHEVIPGGRVDGKVLLDDQDLYARTMDPVDVRRTVGMVFQRPNPFPTMSIKDNVAAGLKLNGVKNKKRLDEVVEKSLKGANLWNEVKDRLDKPGAGLSGGQQQRLCIARAIAVEPQVLLMDEPCSALDPISTLAIEDLINELKSLHDRHRHAQHAAGGSRLGPDRLLQPQGHRPAGPPGRGRGHAEDLQQPRRAGDRGLHQRSLRLIGSRWSWLELVGPGRDPSGEGEEPRRGGGRQGRAGEGEQPRRENVPTDVPAHRA